MSSTVERALERFLRDQLFRNREGQLEKFVLRHARSGIRGQDVDEWPIVQDDRPEGVLKLRDEILVRAQEDANGLGARLQSYVVMALEQGQKVGPRHTFRLAGEGDEEGDGEEPATKDGLIAQQMRHNEALVRLLVSSHSAQIQSNQRTIEQQSALIEAMTKQRQEAFTTLEAARSQEAERDLQMMLVGKTEERKDQAQGLLMDKVNSVFPIVLAKLTGQPMAAPAEMSVIKKLLSGMTEEQLKQIASALKPEQQMLFFALMREAQTSGSGGNPPNGSGTAS